MGNISLMKLWSKWKQKFWEVFFKNERSDLTFFSSFFLLSIKKMEVVAGALDTSGSLGDSGKGIYILSKTHQNTKLELIVSELLWYVKYVSHIKIQ